MKNISEKKIAIIGCGNLGKSLLEGLLSASQFEAKNITATKRNLDAIKEYEAQGVQLTSDNKRAVAQSDLIILALKPHNILSVLESVSDEILERHTVISLATGVSLEDLKKMVNTDISIFRAMPNTATSVKESITCICGTTDEETQISEVKAVFNELGETVVINEDLMEAATVVGACGIAFVLRFIRAMIQGGIQIGFDAKTASQIVNQTVKGASQLLIQNEEHPEFEIDKVTTPKGCTIAGLNEMEHNGFSSALIKGIVSSFEKIEN